MEEQVGQLWDRLVRRLADTRFPEAAVGIAEVELAVGVMFRALGGDSGLQLTTTEVNARGGRRGWLQRIAGLRRESSMAWRDEDYLRLPAVIDCFSNPEDNRSLYLWLAALASADPPASGDWLWRCQFPVCTTLERYPGLRQRYERLCRAHITTRPDPAVLGREEAALESAIRQALLDPGSVALAPPFRRPPAPVPLWLLPYPPEAGIGRRRNSDANSEPAGSGDRREVERLRKRGELVDSPESDRGLVTIRMENILSWGEFVKVDRGSEDEEDAGRSEDIARDIDKVAIGRDGNLRSAAIRFDLDLPGEDDDDRVLDDGVRLPEWDHRSKRLIPNQCRIVQLTARWRGEPYLPEHLRPVARKLRNRFHQLAPARVWHDAQPDGDEVDLEAYQRFLADRESGRTAATDRLYRSIQAGHRDLACLLLADLSLSTDAHVNDHHRVIDIIRDSLYLFAESLTACGDAFAIQGFSSRRRDPIRIHRIKDFNEIHGRDVRARISQLKPGYYTRMGAAIRFAAGELGAWPASRRLLLILTDGKPNDLDRYEGRHGVEDTRMAVKEVHRQGVLPFCISIDREANEYLPYLFGVNHYVVVNRPEELPNRLTQLYAMLTS